MDKKSGFLQKLMDHMDLPGEPLPGRSTLELLGDTRIRVEHHGGVLCYGSDRILLRVSYGLAEITGHDLEIQSMTVRDLIISGGIAAVALKREGKE